MRTLAQSALDICGHSKLAERFQLDRHYDPHLEFAARLGQVTVDEATALMAGKDEGIKKLRQQAKVCNFGFPGGMGPPTFVQFAKGWGVTIEEGRARVLKKAFMDQWPEMWTYFRHVSNIVGEAGEGTMIHPQSGFRRGDCPYTEIANGYFQTLAAHASKAALFEVSRRCYNVQASYLYGSRPVLFVHDEIVAETPEEAGHEAAQEMEAVMVEQMEDWTPNVPSAASAKLMRCWSKQAEQVFDAKGRMIPWDESHT
jgi:DNA polymerase I-like protein with 3'-5' exonuclease and polymerase domains